jgi:hypothetical protein
VGVGRGAIRITASAPIDVSLPLENTYWIVHPKLASREPSIVALRDWLPAEAADEERRLRGLRKR